MKRRQVKVDLTPSREEILLHLAEETDSIATNGPSKGEVSIGAMVRRICDGQISLYYKGKKIGVPLKYFLECR